MEDMDQIYCKQAAQKTANRYTCKRGDRGALSSKRIKNSTEKISMECGHERRWNSSGSGSSRRWLPIMLLTVASRTTTAWTMPVITTFATATNRRQARPLRIVGLWAHNADSSDKKTSSNSIKAAIEGVTLKVAFDQNWGVAEMANDVPSVRFTCGDSLDMVHRLRRDSDAVLVGRGTVERDDCSLLVRRGVEIQQQPLRVILDPRLSLLMNNDNDDEKFQIFKDGMPTVVYHSVTGNDDDDTALTVRDSVTLVSMTDERQEKSQPGAYFSPQAVIEHLKQEFNVQHLMVEGGPQTALNFLNEKLVDRAIIVKAPIKFVEPYPSGMTSQTLLDAGLELLGTVESGVDMMEYWSRPGLPWPTDPLENWP